ncbi:alpha/beta hydrolase [Undibacterium arcticum]
MPHNTHAQHTIFRSNQIICNRHRIHVSPDRNDAHHEKSDRLLQPAIQYPCDGARSSGYLHTLGPGLVARAAHHARFIRSGVWRSVRRTPGFFSRLPAAVRRCWCTSTAVGGARSINPTFSFIAPAYTRAGVNVALLNYTLAPQATLADITLQQLRALAWLYRNAHKYDFDPHRIVVSGHSAGGHLSAMLMTALWPVYGGDLPPDLVRAGVLLSGLYDLEPVRQADYVNLDLKLTPASANVLSPVLMAPSHPAPFITAVGGQESDEFKRQNSLIGQAWQANFAGDIALPDANHMTICDAFATPGDALFEATRKLIADLA